MTPERRARIARFVDDSRRLEEHGGVTPIETTTRRIIEMGDALDAAEARAVEAEATLADLDAQCGHELWPGLSCIDIEEKDTVQWRQAIAELRQRAADAERRLEVAVAALNSIASTPGHGARGPSTGGWVHWIEQARAALAEIAALSALDSTAGRGEGETT